VSDHHDASTHPAGWHPDPFQRHQLRYWDGGRWTEHVSDHGVARIDAPVAGPGQPAAASSFEQIEGALALPGQTPQQVSAQVARTGIGAAWVGDGTLFNEPILVVNQKAKLLELNNEYAIHDQHGRQVGAVRQIGQSSAKKALRLLTSMDQYMTHKLEVVDHTGQVCLNLTRPAKVMKSKVQVTNGHFAELGTIVQQNMVGKIRFGLESGGSTYGTINAENWRAWNFAINDHTGTEVARITKTFAGLANAMFTQADHYVVHLHQQLPDPLRSLIIAAAVSVDTALKQDAQGFN
jgi:uncharacterized protein YxjI